MSKNTRGRERELATRVAAATNGRGVVVQVDPSYCRPPSR